MKTIVGIDWSEKKYCVHIFNEQGAQIARLEVTQSVRGFQQLAGTLARVNPSPAECLVAIETAHDLLVDFLHSQGYTLYILAPSLVHGNRSRQGNSGAKDDDRDAQLLADILRTDRGTLIPWQPDGPLLRQMRTLLSWVDALTKSLVQQHNRLRANLLRYYPQALSAFKDLQAKYALHILSRYPTASDLDALTLAAFSAFCHKNGYYDAHRHALIWATLCKPAPALEPALLPAYAWQTVSLAESLLRLQAQKEDVLAQVHSLFQQHPDAPVFASLPGAGKLLAPSLLVMFGDHRQRYPVRHLLPTIAGTAPITVASGKSRSVRFRRACNRQYRRTAQQFARSSISQSAWAAAYFNRALDRGLGKSHAYRCLANRWLHIIWSLWQKREPYDEAYHLQQVSRHRRPQRA